MRRDRLDIEQSLLSIWDILAYAVVIAACAAFAQHLWVAEREFQACMKQAGNSKPKQEECRLGKAPSR